MVALTMQVSPSSCSHSASQAWIGRGQKGACGTLGGNKQHPTFSYLPLPEATQKQDFLK